MIDASDECVWGAQWRRDHRPHLMALLRSSCLGYCLCCCSCWKGAYRVSLTYGSQILPQSLRFAAQTVLTRKEYAIAKSEPGMRKLIGDFVRFHWPIRQWLGSCCFWSHPSDWVAFGPCHLIYSPNLAYACWSRHLTCLYTMVKAVMMAFSSIMWGLEALACALSLPFDDDNWSTWGQCCLLIVEQ